MTTPVNINRLKGTVTDFDIDTGCGVISSHMDGTNFIVHVSELIKISVTDGTNNMYLTKGEHVEYIKSPSGYEAKSVTGMQYDAKLMQRVFVCDQSAVKFD